MIYNVGGGAGIFKTKYKNAAEEKKWFTTKIDSLVANLYIMLQSCPARFKNLYSGKGLFSLQNRSWSKTPQKSRPSSHIFHPLAKNLCRRVSDPLWREFCDAMRLAVILTLALLVQAKDNTMRTHWPCTWRTKALKEGLPSCHQCNNKIDKSHI